MTSSRIYRQGVDERYYRANVTHDMIKMLVIEARRHGIDALEDIQRAMVSGQDHDIAFFAYFAGVAARRAFTVASKVLELYEEERRCFPDDRDRDWSKS